MDDIIDLIHAGLILVGAIVIIIITGFGVFMGISWVCSGYEYKAWNKLHGTSYTQMDWFGGSEFIKKYHYPERDNTEKFEVNANVNN